MNKITVKIDGMMCGMCEAYICDTIRKAFPDAKKVKASRKGGEATSEKRIYRFLPCVSLRKYLSCRKYT